jgi:C-terminal processing protease CtpA/Prc
MPDFTSTRSLIYSGIASFALTGVVMLSSIASEQTYRTALTKSKDMFPGFTALQAAPPKTGIVVTSLESYGPAERAGVQVGDNIVAINYFPVVSLGQARALLQRTAGPTIQLHLLHNHVPNDVSLSRIEGGAHGT